MMYSKLITRNSSYARDNHFREKLNPKVTLPTDTYSLKPMTHFKPDELHTYAMPRYPSHRINI